MSWWQIMAYICWFIIVTVTCVIVWSEYMDKRKVSRERKRAEDNYFDNKEQKQECADDTCDACGKYKKRQNSMLCKDCEEKANGKNV